MAFLIPMDQVCFLAFFIINIYHECISTPGENARTHLTKQERLTIKVKPKRRERCCESDGSKKAVTKREAKVERIGGD